MEMREKENQQSLCRKRAGNSKADPPGAVLSRPNRPRRRSFRRRQPRRIARRPHPDIPLRRRLRRLSAGRFLLGPYPVELPQPALVPELPHPVGSLEEIADEGHAKMEGVRGDGLRRRRSGIRRRCGGRGSMTGRTGFKTKPSSEDPQTKIRLIPLAPAPPTFGDERAIGARLQPATDKMLIAPEATA